MWDLLGSGLQSLHNQPLREAEPVRGRVAFFDERVDVIVDGRRPERLITPWPD